jgi:hypothetical protein
MMLRKRCLNDTISKIRSLEWKCLCILLRGCFSSWRVPRNKFPSLAIFSIVLCQISHPHYFRCILTPDSFAVWLFSGTLLGSIRISGVAICDLPLNGYSHAILIDFPLPELLLFSRFSLFSNHFISEFMLWYFPCIHLLRKTVSVTNNLLYTKCVHMTTAKPTYKAYYANANNNVTNMTIVRQRLAKHIFPWQRTKLSNTRTLGGGDLYSVRLKVSSVQASSFDSQSFGIRKRVQCSNMDNGSWRRDRLVNQNQVSHTEEKTLVVQQNGASLRQSSIWAVIIDCK